MDLTQEVKNFQQLITELQKAKEWAERRAAINELEMNRVMRALFPNETGQLSFVSPMDRKPTLATLEYVKRVLSIIGASPPLEVSDYKPIPYPASVRRAIAPTPMEKDGWPDGTGVSEDENERGIQ